MMKKLLKNKLFSLFIALFIAGTILPTSVISYSKPVLASDVNLQSGGTSLSTVSAGFVHSLALSSDGTIWAWGDNSEGQLGNNNGELQKSSTPVHVSDLTNVVAVAAGGSHSLAVKKDGTVWSWGSNQYGQAGFGKIESRAGGPAYYMPDQFLKTYTPIQVQGLTHVIAISAGIDYSLALTSDGTVWTWGSKKYGQAMESSDGEFNITPKQVEISSSGIKLTGITKISAGGASALALKNDGTVLNWGYLRVEDDGVHNPADNAQKVYSLTDVVSISAGYSHSLALKNDGTVWGWGSNKLFELGDRNISENWDTPLQINGLNHVHAIAAGLFVSQALKTDGTVWNWGGELMGATR